MTVSSRPTTLPRRALNMLPWLSALVLVAGAVLFVGAYFKGDASSPTAAPEQTGRAQTAPAQTTPTGKPAKLDAAARAVAREFIGTAVARKDLAKAWPLLHPSLKQGLTLAQWKTGEIPVVPYPVDDPAKAKLSVDEAYPDSLLLKVEMRPRKGVQIRPGIFLLGLRRVGAGENRRWLVDYWMPRWSPPIPAPPG